MSAFICKSAENCIKEEDEDEEEFVQLYTECNRPCETDDRDSSGPQQSEFPHSSLMARSICSKNESSIENVKLNKQSTGVNNRCSTGRGIGLGVAGNTNENYAPGRITELADDNISKPGRHAAVAASKHQMVGASTSQVRNVHSAANCKAHLPRLREGISDGFQPAKAHGGTFERKAV